VLKKQSEGVIFAQCESFYSFMINNGMKNQKIVLFRLQTDLLLKAAFDEGKKVYLPRIDGQDGMSMIEIFSFDEIAAFPTNRWGIREPGRQGIRARDDALISADLDLIFVPGLAFDSKNRRLGRPYEI
jgi:5-formyltetrahydrofolate cyclo-ligase